MATIQERYRFFLDEHAGYVVGRAAEGALDLARAEAWAEEMEDAGRLSIRWEYDDEPYDQDIYTQEEAARKFDTGAWTGPYGCVLRLEGDVAASLWGIVFGPEELNDPYARVVAAELAAEARSDFAREEAERERAARQDIATVGAAA